jgi:hypothetical protein
MEPNTLPDPKANISNNIPTDNTGKKAELKNKKMLTRLVIVVAALLISIGGFMVLSGALGNDSSKAKNTANSFMKAMTSGNADKAISYGFNVDDSQKLFYQSSTDAIKGNYTFKEAKEKDGKYYVRYDLSSEGNKSARVQLVKVENKWLVEGLFYSYEQLPTIPAADKDTVNKDQKALSEECAVESLAAQGPDVINDPRCPSPR